MRKIKKRFAGDKKVGESIFTRPEKFIVAKFVNKIPREIETYHLTLLTIVWSVLVIIFSFLSRQTLHFLWVVSLLIVMQYITDLFDGAVGRERNTGLIKWGFYMDHFLDYIFLSSLIIGYYIISPGGQEVYFMILLTLSGGFMVSSFLSFAATNEFKIYFGGIGPTEMRLIFIIINTILIFTGTQHFKYSIPIVVLVSFLLLLLIVYRAHCRLWEIDMAGKVSE